MPNKTLNQRLAENLAKLMEHKKISSNQLGKKAGVSPRTLANYLKTDHNPTDKGKERSAKLTEVEKIAAALGVNPLVLLIEGEATYFTPRAVLTRLRNERIHSNARVIDPAMSSGDFLVASVDFISGQLAAADQVTRDAAAPLLERLANSPEDGARIAQTLLAIMAAAKADVDAKRSAKQTASA